MKRNEAISGLIRHARSEILKEFRDDSCIASTAIGLDVLTHFGVLAEPLAVRTLIFNEAFASRIEGGASWPKGDEIKTWLEEDGSYSLGIGMGTPLPGHWAGHLVLLVEKKILIDLSIDQANRPQYNMKFDPFSVEVDNQFLRGIPKVFKHNGCVIRIDVLPNNMGYITSPDWIFVDRRKKTVDNIIRAIKGVC